MPSTPPPVLSSILLPSPATTPNRKRATLSLRNNTHSNHSPTHTTGHVGVSYLSSPTSSSPPSSPLSSPSLAVDDKHRDQFVTYKRNPVKVAAANRSATLENRWHGRRLSEVVEEGPSDDREVNKKHDSISAFTHPTIYFQRYRSRRYLLYFLGALALYYTLIRPFFSSFNPSTPPLGSSSAGSQAKAKSTAIVPIIEIPPLRSRPKVPDRVRLPQSVLSQDLPDHPIERGMLKVNPASQVHPIYQLIREARIAWDQKVANQSKSLQDAVTEYKRRYHQLPPKGFDKWWDYVCEHNVQLPDEYDRIHHDIHPFRALSSRELRLRTEAVSSLDNMYTLRVRHGSVRTSSTCDPKVIIGADERLAGQAELMNPIAHHLDDLTVVYSVHDTPTGMLSWEYRQEVLEHIEEEELIEEDTEIDLTKQGWSAACPPSSALGQYDRRRPAAVSLTPSTALDHKTFISNHSSFMDLCDHPEHVALHGFLSGRNPTVQPLSPIFSLAKTSLHSDILGVPTEQWSDNISTPHWYGRPEEKLLWRGSNTGTYYDISTPWRTSHRARLLRLANQISQDEEDEEWGVTLLPAPKLMRGETLERMTEVLPWGRANRHYMDVAFTGTPIQCNDDDGTCYELWEDFRWEEMISHEDAMRYKYIVDVDGNAWSARFQRLLTSGSLIFKSTIMPEWWTDRIQPWLHYVPVQIDYSDLYDALIFFRGDRSSRGGEPELAREIAESGRDWSLTHWRKEDMTAYVFRLYLEWARLVADRRESMNFVM